MKLRFLFIFLLLGLIGILPVGAQTEGAGPSATDSLDNSGSGLFDEGNKNTFRVLFSGNPGRAALYSLILPGGGQFYNKRYWKIPLVYGALGGVGYLYYNANQTYQIRKKEYLNSFDTPQESLNFAYYQDARKSREQALFAVIGVYLFNVFDAYIDRHLIDFDMSEDLSLRVRPYPDGLSPVGLTLVYPLR
jgi:hypothetical protein